MTFPSSDGNEKVEFKDVHIVGETDMAIRCFGITTKAEWVPKKCVHDDSEIWKRDERGTLTIMRWFAEEKGWV